MPEPRAAVILAAGHGTRMRSSVPKVLHPVGGRAMLAWLVALAREAGCERIVVVAGAHAPEVGEAARAFGADTAVQDPPLGTGHAVRSAEAALAGFAG
ncbi:MAG: NTP transferase domain-containing protein, partial [Pseudomonadota bacterium]